MEQSMNSIPWSRVAQWDLENRPARRVSGTRRPIHDAVTQPPAVPEACPEQTGLVASANVTTRSERERHLHPDVDSAFATFDNGNRTIARTSRLSLAPILGLCGALLMLYAMTAPLFSSDFVVSNLAQSILPFTEAELAAATADAEDASMVREERTGADADRVEAAQSLLALADRRAAMSASDLATLMIEVDATEIPAGFESRRTAARMVLVALLIFFAAAVLGGVVMLLRRLAPLDRTQITLHGAVGGVGVVVFGLLTVACVVDPVVGEQLAMHGVVAGLLGCGLFWTSSVVSIERLRDFLVLPLIGVAGLAATVVFAVLLVTL